MKPLGQRGRRPSVSEGLFGRGLGWETEGDAGKAERPAPRKGRGSAPGRRSWPQQGSRGEARKREAFQETPGAFAMAKETDDRRAHGVWVTAAPRARTEQAARALGCCPGRSSP